MSKPPMVQELDSTNTSEVVLANRRISRNTSIFYDFVACLCIVYCCAPVSMSVQQSARVFGYLFSEPLAHVCASLLLCPCWLVRVTKCTRVFGYLFSEPLVHANHTKCILKENIESVSTCFHS